jgi:hypothetical protein
MSAQQLIENGDRPQTQHGLEYDDDLAFPDIEQRIGASAPTWRLLLRSESWTLIEPIRAGDTRFSFPSPSGNSSRVRLFSNRQ